MTEKMRERWATHGSKFGYTVVIFCCILGLIQNRNLEKISRIDKARFETMSRTLERAHLGYIEWDTNKSPMTASKLSDYTQRILHRPPPQKWLELVHPDDKEKVDRILKASIKDGSSYVVTYRVIGDDGTERPIYEIGATDKERNLIIGIVMIQNEHEIYVKKLSETCVQEDVQ